MSFKTENNYNVFWVKVVGMLQHNWAIIENRGEVEVIVSFIQDDAMIFDSIKFNSQKEAVDALICNEFIKFENHGMKEILTPPKKPYGHISNPIYSSGQYWKTVIK